ncbi:MAG TPA: DUF1501 domain-containing protein [Planctomycetes bacterium]|nr:DUF1501 domain-containing protein [Planctomycetota bacterium]
MNPGMDRRAFLGWALGGSLSLSLRPLAGLGSLGSLSGGDSNFLVILNLAGGNDGLNSFPPLHLPLYRERRPRVHLGPEECLAPKLGTKPAPRRFHPSLAQLARRFEAGQMAILQKVGYPKPNLSHFVSEDIWSLGLRHAPKGKKKGWIARLMDAHLPDPRMVLGIGTGQKLDFQGGRQVPFLVSSKTEIGVPTDTLHPLVSRYIFEHQKADLQRLRLPPGALSEVAKVQKLAFASVEETRKQLARYVSNVVYPKSRLGQDLRLAARFLCTGFPTRLVYTQLGGFDHHRDQGRHQGRQADLLRDVDQSLHAFLRDLEAHGLLDRALVLVVSEFGRRNYDNGSLGTDHGEGNDLWVLGKSVRPGFLGPDLETKDLQGENLPYALDFRRVYAQALQRHLHLDPKPVFPEEPEAALDLPFLR